MQHSFQRELSKYIRKIKRSPNVFLFTVKKKKKHLRNVKGPSPDIFT